ncbi:MAG: hypothetical protein WCP32_15025 [Bacteroidota bacterium]
MKRLTTNSIFYVLIVTGLLLISVSCKKTEDDPVTVPTTVIDMGGNVYHTISIGSQVWIVENMKVMKYNDGTEIPLVTDSASRENLKTSGNCWYDNNESTNKNI